MRKMYFCVGCRQLHYDDDYSESDGDLLITNEKAFFESVESVKDYLKRYVKVALSEGGKK